MAKFNIYTTKRSQAYKDGYNQAMQYRAAHGALMGKTQIDSIAFKWAQANGFDKMKDYRAGWMKGISW